MEKKSPRLILLFGLCTLALLPMMLLRDATVSNELRYLSIVDEALRDGHLFAFYNHGAAYADKPPLFFWLMMAGRLVFGCHSMLYLSLLSLVPAFVTVAVLDRWCTPVMKPELRTAAAAALLSAFYFAGSAVVVRMDMLMTMFITLALYTFYRMYDGDRSLKLRIAFPLYVFAAIFSKGAVGLLVPLLCIPVFLLVRRQLRTVGRYWGWMTWAILAALCGIWFFMAWREGGAEYLNDLLFHQTVGRAVNAFYHKAPFYFYALHYWYILFPWCILAAGSITIAAARRQPVDERVRFFAVSAAVVFVMLSCFSSKLDIYFLPAVGLLIYATFLLMPGLKADKFVKWSVLVPLFLAAVALPVAFSILRRPETGVAFAPMLSPWILVPVETGVLAAIAALFRSDIKTVACCFAAGIYVSLSVSGLQIRQINPYIGYRTVCEEAVAAAQQAGIDRFALAADDEGNPLLERGENIDTYIGKAPEIVPISLLEDSADAVIGDSNGIIVFSVTDKKPTFAVYGKD